MNLRFILFFFSFISLNAFSGINKDSLWSVWNDPDAKEELKFAAMSTLAKQGYVFSQPDSSIYCAELLFIKASKSKNLNFMANARNTQGIANAIQGKFNLAIPKYMEALELYEETENLNGQASTLNNIGVLYSDMEDLEKSLDFYKRSLTIKESLGDSLEMASTLNNIGVIYKGLGDFDAALYFYQRSYNIEQKAGKIESLSSTLNNMAIVYLRMDSISKAELHANQSLEIGLQYNLEWDLTTTYNILSIINFEMGKYQKSIDAANQAEKLAISFNGQNEIKEAKFAQYKAYRSLNDYKNALIRYEEFIDISAEIESEETQKEIIRQELKYVYEKEAIADSTKNAEEKKVREAELAVEIAENKRQKQQSYFLYLGLFIFGLFGIFIFNRFRVTRKQKDVIESQKKTVDQAFQELEEKNTEILDSINYAKRIQKAILPPDSLLKKALPENFVLYKPKDIVAGDFYWLEEVENSVLFAAADCTGHGVPGAMVSVICNNGLNRSVREFGLTDPGQILDKTREIVIQEFEKSDEEVKDGMDIAMCSLTGLKLKYSGAHNPLWIIRNGEIIETKADKQPIGKFIDSKPFKTHEFELQKGDSFYIFSDGFVDQFGGEKGKKFKPKALRELLLNVQTENMNNQHELLMDAFEKWRGTFEQIDDVCVIGVKV